MAFYHWLGIDAEQAAEREATREANRREGENWFRTVAITGQYPQIEADGWITLHPKLNDQPARESERGEYAGSAAQNAPGRR